MTFYEDFPYALVERLQGPRRPRGRPARRRCPPDVSIVPEYADITDQLERKIMGISLYESQIERLFDGKREMAEAVRSYGRAMAEHRRRRRVGRAVLGVGPRLSR